MFISIKQTTQRLIVGWFLFFSFLNPTTVAANEQPHQQFVSLTLCSDRLLMALAEPSQIAALSPFSKDPNAMLDKINSNKPVVKANLSDLLPYINTTLLINERFYPQLITRLRELNFRIIAINDSPQTVEELHQFIRRLGNIVQQPNKAEQLIKKTPITHPSVAKKTALFITENGLINLTTPQFKTLSQLIDYQAAGQLLSNHYQHVSPEQILRTNPDAIIRFRYSDDYSDGGQWLSHPALQQLAKNKPIATIPVKYTYCFDHGVWQGAKQILQQLNP